jgi:peptide-methionine (S)-S-oxide reductase
VGTQYRSAVYATTDAQLSAAQATRAAYAPRLTAAGLGSITTEIRRASDAGQFFYAEGYHQQYLDKNPHGYCPINSTGVACPIPSSKG